MDITENQEKSKGLMNNVLHHAVLKNSSSTACRVLVNSCLNGLNCVTLIDVLPKWPNSLADLYTVLIKFRCFEVPLIWELSKA